MSDEERMMQDKSLKWSSASIINNDKKALNLFVLMFLLIISKNFIPEYSILIKCKPIKPIIKGKK